MEPSVSIDVELDSAINYAMQQNGVPIIKLLRVTNLTDEQLDDLTVTITAQPEFFAPNVIMLSPLGPGSSINLGTIDLRPSHDFLANLTEKVIGSITISVKSRDELLTSNDHRIDVLAYDEWPGLNSPPELMAAFVTPNSAAVERVLRDASQILKEWSGSASLSGYLSRRTRSLAPSTRRSGAIRSPTSPPRPPTSRPGRRSECPTACWRSASAPAWT